MEVYTLTEDEKHQRSLELAETVNELYRFAREFEIRFEQFRCAQKELQEKVAHLANVVRSGVEQR